MSTTHVTHAAAVAHVVTDSGSTTVVPALDVNLSTRAADATLTGGTQIAIAKGPIAVGAAVGSEKPALIGAVVLHVATMGHGQFDTSAEWQTVLAEIHEQLRAGRLGRAIDAVYDALDELLLAKSFGKAVRLMSILSKEQVPLPILLSALTISLPWRQQLGSARKAIVDTVQRRALKEGGEEKVSAVLQGLV